MRCYVRKLRKVAKRIQVWYKRVKARKAFVRAIIETHLESNCTKYNELISRYRGTTLYRNVIQDI